MGFEQLHVWGLFCINNTFFLHIWSPSTTDEEAAVLVALLFHYQSQDERTKAYCITIRKIMTLTM